MKESVEECAGMARSRTKEIKNAPPMPSKDPKAAPSRRLSVVFRTWISKKTMTRPHSRPATAAYLSASSKGRKYQPEAASSNMKANRMISRLFTETTPHRVDSASRLNKPTFYTLNLFHHHTTLTPTTAS